MKQRVHNKITNKQNKNTTPSKVIMLLCCQLLMGLSISTQPSFSAEYVLEEDIEEGQDVGELTDKKRTLHLDEAHMLPSTYESIDDADALDEPDPLEPFNRFMFEFNNIIDGLILRPAAILYDFAVNEHIALGIRHAIDNVLSPVVFINNVLQGEGDKAAVTVFRFVVNSTLGLFGLFDVAKEMGAEANPTTFNETLAVWGLETGPYLVLPILGPSSIRDTFGKATDYFVNPWYYICKNKVRSHNHHRQQMWWLRSVYGLDALDYRKSLLKPLDDLKKTSSDFYVAMRSIHFQKQEAIKNKIKNREHELKKQ